MLLECHAQIKKTYYNSQALKPCVGNTQQQDAQVNSELLEIIDICKKDTTEVQPATEKEVIDALRSLNTGKSPDIVGVAAEHLIYAFEASVTVLARLMNDIFVNGNIPDIMKQGLLTPVYKKRAPVQTPETIEE